MTRTLAPADLARHLPYGLDLRHDLPILGGTVIPAWTTIINLGQPDGVTVSRYASSPVPVVICRAATLTALNPGDVYAVDPRRLLVALGEIDGKCECRPDDRRCPNNR